MERIASRQNPLVRRFRELARATDSSGAALLDGAHLLQEALRSHVPVDLVAISDRATTPDAEALAEEARRTGARVLRVADQVLAAMSPVRQPSGIVSIARCPPATLAQALDGQPALVLILTGVQDAGNVGAIVRTAEACGATGIITTDGTADPFGWKALRGAMGSTFRMPIAVHQPLTAILRELRSRGIAVIATIPRGGTLPRCSRSSRPGSAHPRRRRCRAATRSGCVGGHAAHDSHAGARRIAQRLDRGRVDPVRSISPAGAPLMSLFDDPETQEAPDADGRRRLPSACGRARSTSSSGRMRSQGLAVRSAKLSSTTACARSSSGVRPGRARRRWRG